jgi:hypothetical protein
MFEKYFSWGNKPVTTAPVFHTVTRYQHQNKFKSNGNQYFDSLSDVIDSYVKKMADSDTCGISDEQTQTRVLIDKQLNLIRYVKTLADGTDEIVNKKLNEYEPVEK